MAKELEHGQAPPTSDEDDGFPTVEQLNHPSSAPWGTRRPGLPDETRFPELPAHPTRCECEDCLNPSPERVAAPPARVPTEPKALAAWLAGEA